MTIKVLDHGYVRFIESWGSDERIIEAARMSTQKGFEGWGPRCECTPLTSALVDLDGKSCERCGKQIKPGDEKLLRFLWENSHYTPFEMGGAVFEIQAPIFVFREWHRHRTQSYNEMSARYAPLPDVNYLPTRERVLEGAQKTSNKQAQGLAGVQLNTVDVMCLLSEEAELLGKIEVLYQRKLKAGFPKELARTHLNVSRYSRMRASANLRNWLEFLSLRLDPAAQWEIRQYAKAVQSFLEEKFPRTMALFEEGLGFK